MFRQDGIVVVPSGQTDVKEAGGKCIHGVYISKQNPTIVGHFSQNKADFCTVCETARIDV